MTATDPTVGTTRADEGRLERCASDMAGLSAAAAEQLIEVNVLRAVTEWRLADATFWQRVKYRARLMRAARHAKTERERPAR